MEISKNKCCRMVHGKNDDDDNVDDDEADSDRPDDTKGSEFD
jgi:hypothetical protein